MTRYGRRLHWLRRAAREASGRASQVGLDGRCRENLGTTPLVSAACDHPYHPRLEVYGPWPTTRQGRYRVKMGRPVMRPLVAVA